MGIITDQTIEMDNLLADIRPERLILTVNRRLALELKGRYDRRQAELGHMAWESANTISWSDWLGSQFQDLVEQGNSDQVLLTSHQSRILWEQVILQFDRDGSILRPSSAASMAHDAWGLIQSWNITTQQLTTSATGETEIFLEWASEYQHRCKSNGWLDSAVLPKVISQWLDEGILTAPAEIILAGFDEITPQQQSLLELLQEKGSSISTLTAAELPATATRFQAKDFAQELEAAARWAIKRLQMNADARVGVVIPQLAEVRSQVETVFRRCFHPGSFIPGSLNPPAVFNISFGVPLQQCPLVVDAFLLLRLASGNLPSGDLSRLLRSPFISGGSSERQGRARLDAFLRSRVGERSMSLDTLIRKGHEFSNRDASGCPLLLQILESYRLRLDHLPTRLSPQKWLDEFNALLNNVGWPRYESLNSTEYQQAESFKQVMNTFQTLGQLQHSMDLIEATARLRTLAGETLFQPKGEETPVQIVGILEAAGLRFDHLWVMGLSDDKWPAPASPNPLLPISLQRNLKLPHASPKREYEYTVAITHRLLASAEEVIVSHPESDGDNDLRVSPLVAGIPTVTLEQLDLATTPDESKLGFGSSHLERLVDDMAPALAPGSHVSGGSRLLSDQSACPFRAFANHRLGTKVIEDPVSGMDARIRGIMIHRVLEKLWGMLGSLSGLQEMDEPDLKSLVTTEVESLLAQLRSSRPETLAPRFIQIEQERVSQLILEWLQLERERTPFSVVSLEHKESVDIGSINLDIVADRVDRLPDGKHLIIDYKTGKLRYRGWFEQRIEEPQLPLYATTDDTQVAGVFLAGVSRAQMAFAGVSESDALVPGIKAFTTTRDGKVYTDWNDLITAWREHLELLAAEVLNGHAKVSPKNRSRDCEYCPLPALCRIHEQEDSEFGEEGA